MELTFGKKEIRALLRGIVPLQMEDKWFVYFEDSVAHFHRSWTGFEILRLHLIPEQGDECSWRATTLEVNSHPEQCTLPDVEAVDALRDLLQAMQG